MNEAGLKGALSTLDSFMGGVRQLVDEGVGHCKDKVQRQEALCLQDRESMLQLLVSGKPLGGPSCAPLTVC